MKAYGYILCPEQETVIGCCRYDDHTSTEHLDHWSVNTTCTFESYITVDALIVEFIYFYVIYLSYSQTSFSLLLFNE